MSAMLNPPPPLRIFCSFYVFCEKILFYVLPQLINSPQAYIFAFQNIFSFYVYFCENIFILLFRRFFTRSLDVLIHVFVLRQIAHN